MKHVVTTTKHSTTHTFHEHDYIGHGEVYVEVMCFDWNALVASVYCADHEGRDYEMATTLGNYECGKLDMRAALAELAGQLFAQPMTFDGAQAVALLADVARTLA